jgi:hypothetical protein
MWARRSRVPRILYMLRATAMESNAVAIALLPARVWSHSERGDVPTS